MAHNQWRHTWACKLLTGAHMGTHIYGVEEVPYSLGNQICHRFPLHKADDSSPMSFKWSVYLNSRSIGSSTWRLICSFAVIQARWPLRALLKRLSSGTWHHSWCMYSMSMPQYFLHTIQKLVGFFQRPCLHLEWECQTHTASILHDFKFCVLFIILTKALW